MCRLETQRFPLLLQLLLLLLLLLQLLLLLLLLLLLQAGREQPRGCARKQ